MGIKAKDNRAFLDEALTFCDGYLKEYPSKLAPFWERWNYRWKGTYFALPQGEEITAHYKTYVKNLSIYASQPWWVRWQKRRQIEAMRRYCLIVELRRDIVACQESVGSVPNADLTPMPFHAIASLIVSSQRAMGVWRGWFSPKRQTLGRLFSWITQIKDEKVAEMKKGNQKTGHNELIGVVSTWQQTLLKYGQQDGFALPSLEKQANDKGWITPEACANARKAAWKKAFAQDKRYLGRGARKGSFLLGGNREETALYYRSLWFALSSFRTSLSLSDSTKTDAAFLHLVQLLREGKALFEPGSKLGKQFDTIAAEITRWTSQRKLDWRADEPDESLEWNYTNIDKEIQDWTQRIAALQHHSSDWQRIDSTIQTLFEKLNNASAALAYLSTQGTTVESLDAKQIYDEVSSAVLELEKQWATWEACQATQADWKSRLDANGHLHEDWKKYLPEERLYFSNADVATLQEKLNEIEAAFNELSGLVKLPPRYHTESQAQAIEEKFSALRALQEAYVKGYHEKQTPILKIQMKQCTALSRFNNEDFDALLRLIQSVPNEMKLPVEDAASFYEKLFSKLEKGRVLDIYLHKATTFSQEEIHALRFFLSKQAPRLASLLLDTAELVEAKRHLRVLGFHYREAVLEETGGLFRITLFLSQYHVEEAFTRESVAAAYKKLSRDYHPDKFAQGQQTVPDCITLIWPDNWAFDTEDKNLFEQPSFTAPAAFICKGDVVYYAIKALSLVLPIGSYEDVIKAHTSLKAYHKTLYATTCFQSINAAKNYIQTHQAVPILHIPFDGEKTPLRKNSSVKRPFYSVNEEDRLERAQEDALTLYKYFVSLLETRQDFEAYKAETTEKLVKSEAELTAARAELTRTKLAETRTKITETRTKITETRTELTETKEKLGSMEARLLMLESLLLRQTVSISTESASAAPSMGVVPQENVLSTSTLGSHGSALFGARSRAGSGAGLDGALAPLSESTEEASLHGYQG